MNTQNRNRPLVRVYHQGCVRNPPEGCIATNIGTWNVRTLNGEGKFQNLFAEMTRLNVSILGIAETHLSTDTPESFESDGYIVIHSSRKDNIHRQGVAIVITKEIANSLVDYKLTSERIMSIDIETPNGILTIFQIYAPDSSYSTTDINNFYDQLQEEINNLPAKNAFVLLGDFNAKVGQDSYSNWPTVVGRFGTGQINNSGERLLQFCAINSLAIVNTLYKQKRTRLYTWLSPDGNTRNQIDYIIVPRDKLKVVKNCRVFNSADIGSDHSLLMAKLCITPKKKQRVRTDIKRYDLAKLGDAATANLFEQRIGGRFEPLLELDTDIDDLYEKFRDATNEVTKTIVGLRRRKDVEGLSQEEVKLCEKRRTARKEMLKDTTSIVKRKRYNDLNKEVKRAVKNAKNESFENKLKLLEEHYQKNESHNLFKTVRQLEEKPKKSLSIVKDGNGVKHFQLQKVLELWQDHFEEHLNTSFQHDDEALNSLETNPDLTLENEAPDPITKEEIKSAIRKMKNRKAPGSDEITAEVMKAGGETMIELLKKIFNKILTSEKTPADFSKMIVTPIHKKGDKLLRENYRAIALLSIPGKVFLKILLERMKEKVDRKIKESQYGFRPGRGTVDAIFIVRQIIEKAKEKDIPLNLHFIDFKAAFDTVWREALWKMLRKIGVHSTYVNIIKYMYENTKCAVTIDKKLTGWFVVRVGVRQGCILSPTLFNIFLEFVMEELSSLHDLHLERGLSTDIRYADDTTLISVMLERLKFSTHELEAACEKWGLKINASKCKVITPEPSPDIQVNNAAVEVVENFVFLGSVVPNSSDDVKRRIALASSCFGRLKKTVWSRKDVPNSIKLRLYNALIVPIAIYASETWTLKAEDSRKLTVFENDCLRAMVGKTRRDRCKIADIKKKLGVKKEIINVIKNRRLNWFGHVCRRDTNSYVKRAYKEEFAGKRKRGRPPKRWSEQVRQDLGIPLLTLERYAQDRNKWRGYYESPFL